jgi:hypothetical protein
VRRFGFGLTAWIVVGTASVGWATDDALERLLRVQVFNKVFEGFERYQVVIESDEWQGDGSREVLAVASGTFLGNKKRITALILVVGEHVMGGQVLENEDLPPCLVPASPSAPSL